ncbi:MAG: SIMPL domain-containing protein, partial [Ottowia sp.]|nr:SIMPL domain-containing protein [Ottowia sp.]
MTPPQNVLQLSATGLVEVQQDLLTLSLSTTREGADAANVQADLRKAVDAALTEVKKTAQAGQM